MNRSLYIEAIVGNFQCCRAEPVILGLRKLN